MKFYKNFSLILRVIWLTYVTAICFVSHNFRFVLISINNGNANDKLESGRISITNTTFKLIEGLFQLYSVEIR